MKLGVNTVLFKMLNARDAMKAVKLAGYDGVELSAIAGMCEHLVLDAWEMQAPLIKAWAKEAEGAARRNTASAASNGVVFMGWVVGWWNDRVAGRPEEWSGSGQSTWSRRREMAVVMRCWSFGSWRRHPTR